MYFLNDMGRLFLFKGNIHISLVKRFLFLYMKNFKSRQRFPFMVVLQKPPIQFIWLSFLRKCVSMTTFVIRGEPAVKREERRCADEITFVEVASTAVPAGSRQSDPGELDVNAATTQPF